MPEAVNAGENGVIREECEEIRPHLSKVAEMCLNYRVTHQVVMKLPLTSKQMFHYGLSIICNASIVAAIGCDSMKFVLRTICLTILSDTIDQFKSNRDLLSSRLQILSSKDYRGNNACLSSEGPRNFVISILLSIKAARCSRRHASPLRPPSTARSFMPFPI